MSTLPSPPRSTIGPAENSEPIGANPAPLLLLLVSLLQELDGENGGFEWTLLPSEDQHAICLHSTRDMGMAVVLPRRPMERALIDPAARVRVRHLLRSAMDALRGRRTGKDTHLTAYFTALAVRSLPGPRCMYCEGPLLAEDPVVIREGSRWHLACPPAW